MNRAVVAAVGLVGTAVCAAKVAVELSEREKNKGRSARTKDVYERIVRYGLSSSPVSGRVCVPKSYVKAMKDTFPGYVVDVELASQGWRWMMFWKQ